MVSLVYVPLCLNKGDILSKRQSSKIIKTHTSYTQKIFPLQKIASVTNCLFAATSFYTSNSICNSHSFSLQTFVFLLDRGTIVTEAAISLKTWLLMSNCDEERDGVKLMTHKDVLVILRIIQVKK